MGVELLAAIHKPQHFISNGQFWIAQFVSHNFLHAAFARFAHWRLCIIFLLHLHAALLIFNLEKCIKTHFKVIFKTDYSYIMYNICLYRINNNDWRGLECRCLLSHWLPEMIFIWGFVLKLVVYHLQLYANVNQIYVRQTRHYDTFEGILILIVYSWHHYGVIGMFLAKAQDTSRRLYWSNLEWAPSG